MAIYALGDLEPTIDPSAYVHPDATVIGDVTLGEGATVWPRAVLRGDYGAITVGAGTSIQDGTVVHATAIDPTVIGAECVVGHLAHLEGCVVEDRCLVGSGSIVLARARIRTGAVVGAAALVPEGMDVPEGALVLGVPARVKGQANQDERIATAAKVYRMNGTRYAADLRRLDG
ncbi:MAG TPA: gamma carbonic anhydrase family protein [Mycobacteriales bacterium]|nr:gamma carbonic anhydrase family protein [Mycobacteriales bacterium]